MIISPSTWAKCSLGINIIHLSTAHGNGLNAPLRSFSLLAGALLFFLILVLQRLNSLRIQLIFIRWWIYAIMWLLHILLITRPLHRLRLLRRVHRNYFISVLFQLGGSHMIFHLCGAGTLHSRIASFPTRIRLGLEYAWCFAAGVHRCKSHGGDIRHMLTPIIFWHNRLIRILQIFLAQNLQFWQLFGLHWKFGMLHLILAD